MFDKVDISDKSLFEAECEKHTLLKDEKSEYRKRAEKAFELAHDIRKFEIELFWKRGTYYWTYIIGSYAGSFCIFLISRFKPFVKFFYKFKCSLYY